jgi:DNA processing protein
VNDEERHALMGLNAWPGLGLVGIHTLLREAGSAVRVAKNPSKWWATIKRKPACPSAEELARLSQEQSRLCEKCQATVWLPQDPDWPPGFQNLALPPPLLFVTGNRPHSEFKKVAVIGSRACTPYGKEQAFRFGEGLAHGGVTVVSGGARGIDQIAMRGGLSGGGLVVGVVGSGLDCPYPPDAAPLFKDMKVAGGCVISEFPFGTLPRRGNFPRRNRLIAALSHAVVVVQASLKSGSLHTVAEALALGIEVFSVPGPVSSSASRGTHQLLRDGCALVESPQEILAHFEISGDALDVDLRSPLFRALNQAEASVDQIAAEVGMEPDLVQMELLEMEIRGRVVRVGGGKYRLIGPLLKDGL